MKNYFIRLLLGNDSWGFYYGDDDAEADGICIGGNRDFSVVNGDLAEKAQKVAEAVYDAWTWLDETDDGLSDEALAEKMIKEVAAAANDALRLFDSAAARKITSAEAVRLYSAIIGKQAEVGFSSRDELDAMCDVLSVIETKKYKWHELHGDSQGEWADFVFPETEEAHVRDYVSSVFFNTGVEARLYLTPADSPDELDDTDVEFLYIPESAAYSDSSIKDFAAGELGCNASQIVILREGD